MFSKTHADTLLQNSGSQIRACREVAWRACQGGPAWASSLEHSPSPKAMLMLPVHIFISTFPSTGPRGQTVVTVTIFGNLDENNQQLAMSEQHGEK